MAGQSIIYNIRNQVFSHIQKLSMNFFDKNPVGRLVTRVTNDTETLNEMYTNVIVTLIQDILILLGAGIIMLRMNSGLAIIVFCSLPFVVIATMIFRIKARRVYRKVRTSLAKVNTSLSENISGMRIIQIFNKEKENLRDFKRINNEYKKASIQEVVVTGIFRPSIELIATGSIALILWFGAGDVIKGAVEFGVLFAFISYISMFFHPIMDMSVKYNIMQSAMASSERIFKILDTKPENDDGNIILEPGKIQGTIEFKNVWFAYNEDEWVLKDVSFIVPKDKNLCYSGCDRFRQNNYNKSFYAGSMKYRKGRS
jgi:ATP-binding cassette subfamily B multidrug efflux pump